MSVILVTGASGLIGSETAGFFAAKGFRVIGVDNDLRKLFFGPEASTVANKKRLLRQHKNYRHLGADIRNRGKIEGVFKKYNKDIVLIVHAAGQPSHDWAAHDPRTDFQINASGTLNLLEAARKFSPQAVFIFTSTNKVYGDNPNRLPFVEKEERYELAPEHKYSQGIDESMSIDGCLHSVFGVSKSSADLLTQEYGKNFGLKTGIFRLGCVTGPAHCAAPLHGFLAYLVKCSVSGRKYQIFGYKGKQVRDNLHASDLVNAFYHYFQNPKAGEIYNLGGGRFANVSILEAIRLCEKLTGNKFDYEYADTPRTGDHIWWISNVSKFQGHYPQWQHKFGIEETLKQIYQAQVNLR
jgi:CDP-paratose 2-epimerase